MIFYMNFIVKIQDYCIQMECKREGTSHGALKFRIRKKMLNYGCELTTYRQGMLLYGTAGDAVTV